MSIYLTLSLTLERYLSIVYPLLTLSLRYSRHENYSFRIFSKILCMRKIIIHEKYNWSIKTSKELKKIMLVNISEKMIVFSKYF